MRQHPLRVVTLVRDRLTAAHGLEACAAGLAAGTVAGSAARASGGALVPAIFMVVSVAWACALSWFIVRRRSRTALHAARLIEAARPDSRNVVITAVELTEHPERARPWIRERVLADADRMLAGLEYRTVVPLRMRAALCVLAIAIAGAALLNVHQAATGRLVSTVQRAIHGTPAARELDVSVILQPPVHTRLASATLLQPPRIHAVEGTRARVTISGRAVRRIRFGASPVASRSEGDAATAEILLRESGYVAIESDGGTVLIPVVVTPDRAPAVKIERPGRDLLVSNTTESVTVQTNASDDFGLELLSLRYTKVSGSGEQYEFVEGELPLAVARRDVRSWSGRAALPLSRLGLEAGDSIVYRVIARDGRPGDGGLASSDTFFIEVAGPGAVALEGFEMPPDRERHALSQQMIVLKIQRLREREPTLGRDALQEQTGAIAAEQRAVRSNFVFLMGGHVEDEEEEAEQSHEIQEGRLENTARRDISRAIGYMSLAERGLVAVDTASALRQARLAVDALQRAFTRNRYILRTLPVRSRADPSRRLSGRLDDARDWTRKLQVPPRDAQAGAIRDLLAALVPIADTLMVPGGTTEASSEVALLAEQALSIDPANPEWQQISTRLTALRHAMRTGAPRDTLEGRLAEALSATFAQARRASLSSAPAGIDARPAGPLPGAWAEEARRRLRPEPE